MERGELLPMLLLLGLGGEKPIDQVGGDQREWDSRRDAQLDRGREKWILFLRVDMIT